jgi:uncharacterized membrane protein YphA (DoxX/SURF4 family)
MEGAVGRAGARGLHAARLRALPDFWNKSGAELLTNQLFFFKNVAVTGGLLMVWALGPGRLSLDKG